MKFLSDQEITSTLSISSIIVDFQAMNNAQEQYGFEVSAIDFKP